MAVKVSYITEIEKNRKEKVNILISIIFLERAPALAYSYGQISIAIGELLGRDFDGV